jgi:NitT/TauT family transport system ATP-binding protein
MRLEIERIWQRTARTVVFVTHDIDEALQLADRIVLLSKKPTRVLETITLDQPRPRDPAGPALAAQRRQRAELFRSLETEPVQENPA